MADLPGIGFDECRRLLKVPLVTGFSQYDFLVGLLRTGNASTAAHWDTFRTEFSPWPASAPSCQRLALSHQRKVTGTRNP
jgi:hypothetical protein